MLGLISVVGALDVSEDFELLALEFNTVGLFNSLRGILLLGKLHVGKTAGKTISKAFELALLNLAELRVEFKNFFLSCLSC